MMQAHAIPARTVVSLIQMRQPSADDAAAVNARPSNEDRDHVAADETQYFRSTSAYATRCPLAICSASGRLTRVILTLHGRLGGTFTDPARTDECFLRLATEHAKISLEKGGVLIGAALLHDGKVRAVGRNRMDSAICHG